MQTPIQQSRGLEFISQNQKLHVQYDSNFHVYIFLQKKKTYNISDVAISGQWKDRWLSQMYCNTHTPLITRETASVPCFQFYIHQVQRYAHASISVAFTMLEVSSSIHIDCMSTAHSFRINYPIFRLLNLSPIFGVLSPKTDGNNNKDI